MGHLNIYERLVCLFYPLLMLQDFIKIFGINLNAFIGLPLMVVITIFSIPLIGQTFQNSKSNNYRLLVFLFLVINLLSVIIFLNEHLPFEYFTTSVKYFIFPMLFCFYGMSTKINSLYFYKSFYYSIYVALGIGLIFYITRPSFYLNFLVTAKQAVSYLKGAEFLNQGNILDKISFSAIFGNVYPVQYFSVILFLMSFYFIKNRLIKNKSLLFIGLFISLISAFLTMQRVVWGFLLLFISYLFFSDLISKKFKILLLSSSIAIVGLVFITNEALSEIVYNQFNSVAETFSFSEAMSERTGQYDNVIEFNESLICGNGLGTRGSMARVSGKPGVSDGEYIRIIAETGLFGFLIFVAIMCKALFPIMKIFKQRWLEFWIVSYFLIACLGSNALSLATTIAPIFWFAVGNIFRFKSLQLCQIPQK